MNQGLHSSPETTRSRLRGTLPGSFGPGEQPQATQQQVPTFGLLVGGVQISVVRPNPQTKPHMEPFCNTNLTLSSTRIGVSGLLMLAYCTCQVVMLRPCLTRYFSHNKGSTARLKIAWATTLTILSICGKKMPIAFLHRQTSKHLRAHCVLYCSTRIITKCHH